MLCCDCGLNKILKFNTQNKVEIPFNFSVVNFYKFKCIFSNLQNSYIMLIYLNIFNVFFIYRYNIGFFLILTHFLK